MNRDDRLILGLCTFAFLTGNLIQCDPHQDDDTAEAIRELADVIEQKECTCAEEVPEGQRMLWR